MPTAAAARLIAVPSVAVMAVALSLKLAATMPVALKSTTASLWPRPGPPAGIAMSGSATLAASVVLAESSSHFQPIRLAVLLP